jgi:hypothetical protein
MVIKICDIKDITSEIKGKVFIYLPTNETFYEDGMDCGGRTYLRTMSLNDRRLPYIFKTFGELKKNDDIIFGIDDKVVPEDYKSMFPTAHGYTQFDFEDDYEFIKQYIAVTDISIQIKYGR